MLDWRQVKKSQAKGYTDTFIRSTYVKPLRIIMKVRKYVSMHILYSEIFALTFGTFFVPSSVLRTEEEGRLRY